MVKFEVFGAAKFISEVSFLVTPTQKVPLGVRTCKVQHNSILFVLVINFEVFEAAEFISEVTFVLTLTQKMLSGAGTCEVEPRYTKFRQENGTLGPIA